MAMLYKEYLNRFRVFTCVGESREINLTSLVLCIKAKLKERVILYWEKRINSDVGMDRLRTY